MRLTIFCAVCTDDFAGQLANQTNLALKGIIGIKAMAQIAGVVGEQADEFYYHVSNGYYQKLKQKPVYFKQVFNKNHHYFLGHCKQLHQRLGKVRRFPRR